MIIVKQIDQYIQQSIDKIHQLVTAIQAYKDNLNEKLEELKQQIDITCEHRRFPQNDLKEWSERLNEVQRIFIEQQTIKIHDDIGPISIYFN